MIRKPSKPKGSPKMSQSDPWRRSGAEYWPRTERYAQLHEVLADETALRVFLEYLNRSFAADNLLFFLAIRKYQTIQGRRSFFAQTRGTRTCTNTAERPFRLHVIGPKITFPVRDMRISHAHIIFQKYIEDGAPCDVSVRSQAPNKPRDSVFRPI
jgi:hypothetical protein